MTVSTDIRKIIERELGAQDNILDALCSISRIHEYKKNDIIIRQGMLIENINILISGILMGYSYSKEGKIVVDCFCFQEGDIAIPPHGMNIPAELNIKAIERSMVIQLPINDVANMIEKFKEASDIYSDKLMYALENHSRIKHALQGYSGKDLYEWFIKEYSQLIDRVPHKYIASFLGMSDVHFSRLVNGK